MTEANEQVVHAIDFFAVGTHPRLTFSSSQVVKTGQAADRRWVVDAWPPLNGRVAKGGVRIGFSPLRSSRVGIRAVR
jgi:hypothetical protein